MFRAKRTKEAPAADAAPEAVSTTAPAGGYQRSELTTFDGRGNPTVIVYTRDAEGRVVKTARKAPRVRQPKKK